MHFKDKSNLFSLLFLCKNIENVYDSFILALSVISITPFERIFDMKFNSRLLVLSSIIISSTQCAEGSFVPLVQKKAESVSPAESQGFYAEKFVLPGVVWDRDNKIRDILRQQGIADENACRLGRQLAAQTYTYGKFFDCMPPDFVNLPGDDIAQAAIKRREAKLKWAGLFLTPVTLERYRRISAQEMGQYPT